MAYSESRAQSETWAKAAVESLRRLSIPLTPPNYSVWYGYHTGQFPDLKRTLDILLSSRQPFTAQINDQLYERFFGFEREGAALRDASAKIETAIAHIVELIEQAGLDAGHYAESLQSFSGRLPGEETLHGLSGLIGGIVEETRRMQQRNRSLESRLTESSDEVAELRKSLEDIQVEAMTDSLTRLANRKYFDACLSERTRQAVETGQPLCLMMVDIDHFKLFNDNYGHQLGDRVLRLVADTLRGGLGDSYTPARYGGEEFAVVLPRTHLLKAVNIAEQLREAVAGKQIIHRNTRRPLGKVTMSIGVAQLKFGEPLAELVQRADESLYTAKREGRNRVASEQTIAAQTVAAPRWEPAEPVAAPPG